MFCSSCGKEITEGSRFCQSCGTPISTNTPTPVAQPLPNAVATQPIPPVSNPNPVQNYYQAPQRPINQFINPYKGLVTILTILGVLIGLLCNCGLIKLASEFCYLPVPGSDGEVYGSECQIYGYFPMWLLAFVIAIAGNGNGTEEGNWVVNLFEPFVNIEPAIKFIPWVFLVLAILAFMSFSTGCKVGGKAAMRNQLPPKQLKIMNKFLIVNWIFWVIYTTVILLPMIQFYNEYKEKFFVIEYTVCGYIYTGCLLVMTVLKFVYSPNVLKAYREYEQSQNNSSAAS